MTTENEQTPPVFEPLHHSTEQLESPMMCHFEDQLHIMRGNLPECVDLDNEEMIPVLFNFFMSGAAAALFTVKFGMLDHNNGGRRIGYSTEMLLEETTAYIGISEEEDESEEAGTIPLAGELGKNPFNAAADEVPCRGCEKCGPSHDTAEDFVNQMLNVKKD